jgi:hypothetical protein
MHEWIDYSESKLELGAASIKRIEEELQVGM